MLKKEIKEQSYYIEEKDIEVKIREQQVYQFEQFYNKSLITEDTNLPELMLKISKDKLNLLYGQYNDI